MGSRFHPAPQGTVPPMRLCPCSRLGGSAYRRLYGCSVWNFRVRVALSALVSGCIGSVSRMRVSHLGSFSAVHNRHYIRWRERDAAISSHHTPPTTSSPAAPSVHAGCNVSHLTVGALGVMNEVEDRDRRANFLTRALSVEHPVVLPLRIGYAEAAAAAMTAAATMAAALE